MADQVGKLDRILTLQKRSVSQNDYGEEAPTWTDDQDLRAEIVDVDGEEEYEAKQETPVKETTFRIRYKSKLNASDYRVKYDGTVYNINRVKEDVEGFRRQYMKLVCDAR